MYMRITSQNQIVMISLEQLVPKDHYYRKLLELLNFKHLTTELRKKENEYGTGAVGYGMEILFKCLLLQLMEDLSDRELEQALKENNSMKYFCGFSLTDKTPCYSLFSRVRDRIGTHRLSKLYARVNRSLSKKGLMREVFSFVDASHLISKNALWKERDEAIKKKYEKLNNSTLSKVAVDPQAKIGCKGKNKFWYGYKKSVSVDMQSGLINKVAITPGNIPDSKVLKNVCPSRGVVFMDKGYATKEVQNVLRSRGCEDGVIKKNNMKDKNRDLDRWRTGIRSPYESVFSKTSHRVRYRGVCKNQFLGFMEALSFNLKRLLVLNSPPICLDV